MPNAAARPHHRVSASGRETVNPALFLVRCALLLSLVVYGLLIAVALLFDWPKKVRRERIAGHWSRLLVRLLNLQVRKRGEVLPGAALLVANHVSWLDIPVIQSQIETRFVSKSEVRRWPIAGWLANAAGTFYIRRGSGSSRPLLNRLSPHLAAGGKVCIFPEGTTTDGSNVQTFHARMFCAAIESGQNVVPLALRYGTTAGGAHIAPFVGDDDLFSHLMRILWSPGFEVELTVCGALSPEGQARADLAKGARKSVCTALCLESQGENR